MLGDHEPGQGELVELGQVRRLVHERDAALPRPLARVGESPLRDAQPGALCRDRADVREEPRDVVRRRLVEHRDGAVEVSARAQHSCGDGVPAVPVLEERAAVAQLGGELEVVLGLRQIAPLPQHVGEGNVEVTRHRRAKSRPGCYCLERVLEEPACLVGAAAAGPHGREDDGGAEGVGDVARCAQLPDRLAERIHRGRQVSSSPGREAEEPAGGTPREVVTGTRDVQCPAGVLRGPGEVAPRLRRRRPVDRDHRRQPRHVLVAGPHRFGDGRRHPVSRDHDRGHASSHPTGCRERRLRRVEPGVDAVEVPLRQPHPGHMGREVRSGASDLLGDRSQPVAEQPILPLPAQGGEDELDEVGGLLDVVARKGVRDGLG